MKGTDKSYLHMTLDLAHACYQKCATKMFSFKHSYLVDIYNIGISNENNIRVSKTLANCVVVVVVLYCLCMYDHWTGLLPE